jgi:hypothetical protein
MLNTDDKFEATYGRYEINAKLPLAKDCGLLIGSFLITVGLLVVCERERERERERGREREIER